MKNAERTMWAGVLLVALGFIAYAIGMAYATLEMGEFVDPILEITRDGWVIFMMTHGLAVAIGGGITIAIGAGIMAYADWRLRRFKTTNRFREMRWQRRILR